MRMKYQYNQCELPYDLQSERRDRDVRNFVWVVKKFRSLTLLYVEVLPKVPQFNNVDDCSPRPFGAFNSNSGSNQKSFTLSKQVDSSLVVEGKDKDNHEILKHKYRKLNF